MEKEIDGEKLIVSLLFDEIHIRKLIQYNRHTHTLQGYSSVFNDKDEETSGIRVANQALVFVVNGVNDAFHLPIAYYLISSMDGQDKKNIIENIIEQLIDCDVILSSISFDGFRSNKKMCELFGAILDIDSLDFKPYIIVKGQRIYIFFDACHMVKLIRNSLAAKGVIFNGDNSEIKWQYFVDLVNMQYRGFALTHNMTQTHINWKQIKMKVDIAVETLSERTAASMEFLMKKGLPEFTGAEYTIELVRIFDPLFDIFNTKKSSNANPFKNALCAENAAQIFEFCDRAVEYIKKLKVRNKKEKLIRISKSAIKTGFNGFIYDVTSLKLLFMDYVEERQIIKSLPTYKFSQDPVEILFGKVRGLGGYNDNPSCEEFKAAFRKLLAFSAVMYSRFSSCKMSENDVPSNPYSNILSVTSRRTASNRFDVQQCFEVNEEDIERLYDKLSEIEARNTLVEDLSDFSMAHIAKHIEHRIMTTKQFNCSKCQEVFDENTQKAVCVAAGPCESTFSICKQANRFLKEELLNGTVDFNVIYHEILINLDLDTLYEKTDFSAHSDHKIFLIRYIVDECIRIKGIHIAKTVTLKIHEKSLRVKLHKLLHYFGQ